MSAIHPIREDDQTMGQQLRKRRPYWRRVAKRQAPPVAEVESEDDEVDDGVESEDEPETESIESTPATSPPPQQQLPPATNVLPPLPPPPSATTTTSSTTSATATTRTSTTRALPFEQTQTTGSTSSSTTFSQSTAPTTLLTSQSVSNPAFISTSTTRKTKSSASTIGTERSTTSGSNAVPTFTDPESVIALPKGQTRQHTTLSHGATVALEILGIITGVMVLLGVAFLFWRRYKRRQLQRQGENLPDPPPSTVVSVPASGSHYSSSSGKTAVSSFFGRFFKIHARRGEQNANAGRETGVPAWVTPTADSVVGRKQRLGLVKPELLSEKEENLQAGFMRTPRAPFAKEGDFGRRQTDSLDSRALKLELGAREDEDGGVQAPRKAFLKRNTGGKMVMRGFGSEAGNKIKGLGLTIGAFAGSRKGREEDEQSLVVDAADSGAVEVKAIERSPVNPLAGLSNALEAGKGIGSAGKQDPTMMSGGLRASGRGVGNEGLIVPGNSKEQSVGSSNGGESGVLGRVGFAIGGAGGYGYGHGQNAVKQDGPGLKGLEGLRKGDSLIERGVDRQSFVSGWQGSTTSWGTNVWERLERERELREGRERMEGGLGGTALPNNRASSVAKWRDPVSWVKDQAERRDDGGKN